MRRLLLPLALLFATAAPAQAQFDPLGVRRWSETSPTGHLVVASFTGHAGGVLGATAVLGVCLLRDVGSAVTGTSSASCLKTPFVIAGTAAGLAVGLHYAPASPYKGSVVGGMLTGTAALVGTYYLYLEPRSASSEEASELDSYLDAVVLMAVGTAGTAVGYRFGPGGRWTAVDVSPTTDAHGGAGLRLAVRF